MSHKDDVKKYCADVQSGAIVAGRYCKKAVERFLKDLERQKTDDSFNFVFRPEKADDVIDFAESLVIPDIEKTEENPERKLKLLPWHKFIYYQLFGWVDKRDETKRRFQDCYIEVARKNSKTTSLLFPILLWDFLTTPAAESYFVNKDLLQSEKSFKELIRIVQADKTLASVCEINSQTIICRNSRIAFFADGSTAIDGYKNSCSVIDEYHCYDSDKIVTAFRYGGRSRKNRLILKITSAGLDISKPCYAENLAAKKLLDGLHDDDFYFCIIYAVDDGDDWKDLSVYQKANPSLNLLPALTTDVLKADFNDALSKPAHQPDFKSKTLGIWTNGVSSWIPLEVFEKNQPDEIDFDDFLGKPCGASMDLSDINDFSAVSLCFKDGEKYVYRHQFFIPENTIYEKYKQDNINVLDWVQSGLLTATPGRTIDEDFIFEKIAEWAEAFKIVAFYYDPWQSKELIKRLDENFSHVLFVPFAQSLKNFSAPTKFYEKCIYDGRIIDNNPIMKWMLTNTIVKPDPNGNYKPLKPSRTSTKRIDGVVTAIMARAAIDENTAKPSTAYKSVESLLKSF